MQRLLLSSAGTARGGTGAGPCWRSRGAIPSARDDPTRTTTLSSLSSPEVSSSVVAEVPAEPAPQKPPNFGDRPADFIAPSHPCPTVRAVSRNREQHTLTLVTGEGCHLCEHGRRTLAALGVGAREISVASDEAAALATRGLPLAFLPVLTDGTRVIAYGRFSERRLRRELGR